MTATSDAENLRALCEQLDPRAVLAEVDLLTAARVQAWSPNLTPGAKSEEPPMLLPDHLDRAVRGAYTRYGDALRQAVRAVRQALDEQAFLVTRLTIEEAERYLEGGSCKRCYRTVPGTSSDRLRNGRCRTCDDYFRKHGKERPRELCSV